MGFDPSYSARKFTSVGTRPVRPDGVDKVTGRARYGADFNMPGQLVGRILRSPHAHARIRRIDTSKAEKLKGVKAVITAADLPDLTNGNSDHARHPRQLHGAQEGALRRPCGGRGGRDRCPHGQAKRSTSSRSIMRCCRTSRMSTKRCRPRRRCCTRRCSRAVSTPNPPKPPTSPIAPSTATVTSKRASRKPTPSSNARSGPSRRTRAISSPTPASPVSIPTGPRPVGLHPGPFRLSPAMCRTARPGCLEAARYLIGDRRRFRRQDAYLGRADCAGAVAQGGPAGQARHVARGSLPCLGPDQRHLDRRQDRRHGRTAPSRRLRRRCAIPAAPTPALGPCSAR